MKITPLRCPSCGAKLRLKHVKLRLGDTAHCEHCGTDFVLEKDPPTPHRSASHSAYQTSLQRTFAPILVLLVVFLCAAVFLIPLFQTLNDLQPYETHTTARTTPVSKPIHHFLSAVFMKPASDVTPEELASIKYLDINLGDYYTPDSYAPWRSDRTDVWVFTYSLEDYYAGSPTFEASLDTVFVPKKSGENIDWEDLPCFAGLTWLETNRCSDIHGSGRGTPLAGLKNLKHFGSGFNQDVAEIAEVLADPAQIRALSIGLRTQRDVDALAQFTNLEELTIHYIFYDEINNIGAISALSNLKSLTLNIGEDISWLSALPTLTSLTLASPSISDYSVLYGMPALENLTILTAFDLKDISFVRNMPKLHSFRLTHSNIITLEPLRDHIGLLSLSLERNHSLQNVDALGTLTSLQSLSIDSRKAVFPSLSALQHLRSVALPSGHLSAITGLPDITDLQLLEHFMQDSLDCAALLAFPNLQSLMICDISSFENLGALRNLSALTTLRLMDVSLYNTSTCSSIFNLPHLETLEMVDTSVSIDTAMLNPSPTLRHLSMVNCNGWRFYNGKTLLQERAGASLLSPALQRMTSLHTLELPATMLEDISFASALTELRVLNIADNYVTDIAALSGLPNLQLLYCMQNPIQNLASVPSTTRIYAE